MELSEAIERLKKFDCRDCKFIACEQCEINYGDVQAIRKVLTELDKQKQVKAEMRKVAWEEGYNQGYLAGAMESI